MATYSYLDRDTFVLALEAFFDTGDFNQGLDALDFYEQQSQSGDSEFLLGPGELDCWRDKFEDLQLDHIIGDAS